MPPFLHQFDQKLTKSFLSFPEIILVLEVCNEHIAGLFYILSIIVREIASFNR